MVDWAQSTDYLTNSPSPRVGQLVEVSDSMSCSGRGTVGPAEGEGTARLAKGQHPVRTYDRRNGSGKQEETFGFTSTETIKAY